MSSIKFNGMKELTAGMRERLDPSLARKVVMLNGSEMQQSAMRKAPVDTGQLKRSIMLDIGDKGLSATVSPHTDYAAYVEYGTRFMNAQPYIRPAFNEQVIKFKADLEKIVR